jgi:hypothetical protein
MIADQSALTFDEPFILIAAFIIGVLGTARITRLLVDDEWPPVEWLREQYVKRAPEKWEGLVECPFCMAPWVALLEVLAAWIWDLPAWWWAGNLWMGGSYLASMIVVRDIPPEDRG